MKIARSSVAGTAALALFCMTHLAAQKQEEQIDYYEKWLEEDVVYIITGDERSVFLHLTTDLEHERFIEQFWFRRDLDPRTSFNEFREEHYRRVQYANEHFASGLRGWRTDRGMIYIKFGPPDEITARPAGGHYKRPFYEGGGSTSTYPFEVWRYRYIEGVGEDIEIEFVDPTGSGEFRITTNPWEKDALLTAGGGGPTMIEAMGMSTKLDRIRRLTNPTPGHNPYGFGYGRLKDQPFEKLQLLTNLQRPPKFPTSKLKEFVHAEVRYDMLPFDIRSDYLKLDGEQYVALITLMIPNRELQYVGLEGSIHRTTVNVYGELVDLTGYVVASFEEVVTNEIPEKELRAELQKFSLYQKSLRLRPGRYKLQLVIVDEVSDRIGTTVVLVVLPRIDENLMSTSSIVPALRIESLEDGGFSQFTMGSVRVFPDPKAEVKMGQELPLFFQVYNLGVDQSTGKPMVDVQYVVRGEGEEFTREKIEIRDLEGSTINVVKFLPLEGLPKGKYLLEVNITDMMNNTTIVRQVPFTVIG